MTLVTALTISGPRLMALGLADAPASTSAHGAEAVGPWGGDWPLNALYVVSALLVVAVLVVPTALERYLRAHPDAGGEEPAEASGPDSAPTRTAG